METVVDTYRAKVKAKKDGDSAVCPKSKNSVCNCPGMTDMASETRRDHSKMKAKRSKNPTLEEIAEAAREDCCECGQLLAQYLKEVCKLIWCLSGAAACEGTRLDAALGELLAALGLLASDCGALAKSLAKRLVNLKC